MRKKKKKTTTTTTTTTTITTYNWKDVLRSKSHVEQRNQITDTRETVD
jgi:hypothetical protein